VLDKGYVTWPQLTEWAKNMGIPKERLEEELTKPAWMRNLGAGGEFDPGF